VVLPPAELAARSQVTEEQVREWLRLGLLGPEEDLDLTAAPRRLEHEGEEVVFCSPSCRDRFIETTRTRGGSFRGRT
jgi:hypothetical protein